MEIFVCVCVWIIIFSCDRYKIINIIAVGAFEKYMHMEVPCGDRNSLTYPL